jgi:hypothetical protein
VLERPNLKGSEENNSLAKLKRKRIKERASRAANGRGIREMITAAIEGEGSERRKELKTHKNFIFLL